MWVLSFNLFSDPEIIRIPFSFVKTPAWFISTRRTKISRELPANWRLSTGKSPKRKLTPSREAAAKGQEALWNALLASVHRRRIARIKRDRIERLVILPLSPIFH